MFMRDTDHGMKDGHGASCVAGLDKQPAKAVPDEDGHGTTWGENVRSAQETAFS
jgi:hypothetical protein